MSCNMDDDHIVTEHKFDVSQCTSMPIKNKRMLERTYSYSYCRNFCVKYVVDCMPLVHIIIILFLVFTKYISFSQQRQVLQKKPYIYTVWEFKEKPANIWQCACYLSYDLSFVGRAAHFADSAPGNSSPHANTRSKCREEIVHARASSSSSSCDYITISFMQRYILSNLQNVPFASEVDARKKNRRRRR